MDTFIYIPVELYNTKSNFNWITAFFKNRNINVTNSSIATRKLFDIPMYVLNIWLLFDIFWQLPELIWIRVC